MRKKFDNELISVRKTVEYTYKTHTSIRNLYYAHPQILHVHNNKGELLSTCLNCGRQCNVEVMCESTFTECICKCDWQPKDL